jgi:hypothetical protein
MADVLDVITKLTFDADTSTVEALNAEFGTQIKQIETLQKRQAAYEAQLAKTSQSDIKQRQALITLIENQKTAIDKVTVAIGKQLGENQKLSRSVVDATGRMRNLSFAGSQLLREAPAFTYSIQTGILALSNNIPILLDQLKEARASGASTTSIFKALGQSVFGLTGLITIGVTLLTLFADKLFDSGKAAKEATSAYDDFVKSLKQDISQTTSAIDNQITKLNTLQGVIQNGNIDLTNRQNAIRKLREQYPDLLKNISDEALLQGKANAAFAEIQKQITAKEKQNLAEKQGAFFKSQEVVLLQQQIDRQAKLNRLLDEYNKKITDNAFVGKGGQLAKQAIEGLINQRRAELQVANTELDNNRKRQALAAQQAQIQAAAAADILFPDEKEKEKKTDPYKEALERAETQFEYSKLTDEALQMLLDSEIELNKLYTLLYDADQATGRVLSDEQRQEREQNYSADQKRINNLQEQRNNELQQSLVRQKIQLAEAFKEAQDIAKLQNELRELQVKEAELQKQAEQSQNNIPQMTLLPGGGIFTAKQVKAPDFKISQVLSQEERIAKQSEESIKDSYTNIRTFALQAIQDIFDAQTAALDREIEIRRDRVAQATELAKTGNVAILQEEKERLEKSEKERERVAQKQLQLNALLQASSAAIAATQALQTVTNAGATGDPYTAAARIAAAVAALAAGFAFVTSLTSAFADGVVDYQGKGNGRSDSNIVRISHGESVITAAATKQYAPVLEAMNAGRSLPLFAKTMDMPSRGRDYDYRRLESKLDIMTEAIELNRTEVHARMDRNGFALSTQQAVKADKARFK